jgi:hypothetical protein
MDRRVDEAIEWLTERSPAKVYRPSRVPAQQPLQAVCREVRSSYVEEEYWMIRSSTNFLMWLLLRRQDARIGCHSSHELVIATGGDIPAGMEPMLDVARAAVVLDLGGHALRLQEAVAYA